MRFFWKPIAIDTPRPHTGYMNIEMALIAFYILAGLGVFAALFVLAGKALDGLNDFLNSFFGPI